MLTPAFISCFLGNLRGWEWIIILVVILLLFGGKKIPELMKGLGKGVHSFKKGMQEAKDEINRPIESGDDDSSEAPRGKDRG